MGFQERFLHRILRIVLVAEHPEGEAKHDPAVPFDEPPEGVLVTGPGPLDVRGILGLHLRGKTLRHGRG